MAMASRVWDVRFPLVMMRLGVRRLGETACRAASQVFLVVEPKFVWDAEAVRKREKAIKRAKLAAAELFRVSPLDGPPVSAGKTRSSFSSTTVSCLLRGDGHGLGKPRGVT